VRGRRWPARQGSQADITDLGPFDAAQQTLEQDLDRDRQPRRVADAVPGYLLQGIVAERRAGQLLPSVNHLSIVDQTSGGEVAAVKLSVRGAELGIRDVGIDLRRVEIGVPE